MKNPNNFISEDTQHFLRIAITILEVAGSIASIAGFIISIST